MKKFFLISMLIPFAMVCSCQKQDSAAEQQLAQRKAELDAREKALDEREKALAEREKAITSIRTIRPDLQSRAQVRGPAQLKAESDRKIQQLPPEFQALIAATPDASQLKAEKDSKMRARSSQRQLGPEDLNRQWKRKLASDKAKMSAAVASPEAESPEAEATSPTPSPAVEAASPSPSPMPQ